MRCLSGLSRSRDELGRRDLRVGVLGDAGELVPVEAAVEANAQPAAVADVRRHEEPFRISVDEHPLHPVRGRTPNREAAVAVVVRKDHEKRLLAAHEERRRAVTQTLAGLRKMEADLSDPLQRPLALTSRSHGAIVRLREPRQVRGWRPVSTLSEVAPGLRRWTAWHEEWRQEVGSLAVQTPAGLTLIDPINPPPEVRRPENILLTVSWHARTAGNIPAKHVWAPARAVRRLKNRGVEVTDPFEPGDELPGGIQAYATAREAEVVYWLPDQRAIAVGDVLLGAGAKPHATSEPLRLCPERWLDGKKYRDLKKSLRVLLELPIVRILPSHGDPVLTGGKDVLAALIE